MDKTKFAKLKAVAATILSFGAEKPAIPEAGKFEAFKIKDGETMVEFNPTLEKGSLVFVSSGTGSSPAVNGEFEFDSGVKFKTDSEGKISEVVSDGKEDEDDKLTEEEKKAKKVKEDMSAQVAELFKAQAEAFQSEISALKTKLEGYEAAFAKIPTNEVLLAYTKQLTEIGEAIEAFEVIPVESPIDQPNAEDAQKLGFEKMASAFMGEQANK